MKYVHGWAFPPSDELMSAEIKPDGSYQASHLAAALAHVTDFSCAIDGGAHVGTWSRTLSARFDRVIACEPSPDTFAALLANMFAFGCTNVETAQVALGARAGSVRMVLDGKGAATKNTGARHVEQGGDIPVQTIDSWQLPSLGLLKLDIEGSEPEALRGSRETLTRCKPIVIYEDKYLWKRYGEPREAAARVLSSCGYREIQIVKCDRIWAPR